jgi:Ca2+-dependent lipid-binding protein
VVLIPLTLDIAVSDLQKRSPFNRDPNPFVTINIDGSPEQKTNTVKKCRNPRWKQEFKLLVTSGSSLFT